jgi:protoporphyrinogen oxidase
MYDHFFRGYIEKKLPGLEREDIHEDWWGMADTRNEFNQFAEDDRQTDISSLRGITSKLRWWKGFFFGHQNQVLYPMKGVGDISEYFESTLEASGMTIRYNTDVSNLIIYGNKLEGIELSTGETIHCNKAIWTGRLPDLTAHLKIGWPDSLPYISTAVVLLVFERKQLRKRKFHYEYCADKNIIFQRFYFTDYCAGQADRFGICAEISYNGRRRLPDDKTLVSKSIEGLKILEAVETERLIDSKVVKMPDSHPVYTMDYRSILSSLFCKIYGTEGIFPVGRSGSFRNIGMESAILSGWKIGKYCSGSSYHSGDEIS